MVEISGVTRGSSQGANLVEGAHWLRFGYAIISSQKLIRYSTKTENICRVM